MGNPTTELQQLTNKSIIELFSVELKPDVHFQKTEQSGTYVQNGKDITINATGHGMPVGTILPLNFTSGNAIDGIYTIQSETSNQFVVKSTVFQNITDPQTVSFNSAVNTADIPRVPIVYLFHTGNNLKDNTDLIWQSNTYTKFPCSAEGFEYTGKGKLPRPTLTFSNLLGNITAIMQLVNKTTAFSDLTGAKVTRRRTLTRFLDEENFPSNINPYKVGLESVDPTAELPREIYFIERKVVENKDIVQFELVSTFDLIGIGAPKKLVTRSDFPLVGTLVNF
tara:strand:- start:6155 stop:6997 length:843 start_codon:yes stop_codon:yes gene_type:complete